MNGLVLIKVHMLAREVLNYQAIHGKNFARIGTFGPSYDPKGCRLSSAVSADQSDLLALIHLKREPAKYLVTLPQDFFTSASLNSIKKSSREPPGSQAAILCRNFDPKTDYLG